MSPKSPLLNLLRPSRRVGCLRRPRLHALSQRRAIGVPAKLQHQADAILAGKSPSGLPPSLLPSKRIKTYPPPRSSRTVCKDPVTFVTDSQIRLHDPDGSITSLVARRSPNRLRPGDIVLVRRRGEGPVSGHLIMIRNRGIDSSILLRNELTRVAVEMYIKVYSPLVEGIELVQRAKKRARRARVTYLRKKEHDRGSTEGVVAAYLKRKRDLAEGRIATGVQITMGRRKAGNAGSKRDGKK